MMDLYLSLLQLIMICLLLNLNYIAVALSFVFCLKLKSNRFKCIFSTLKFLKCASSWAYSPAEEGRYMELEFGWGRKKEKEDDAWNLHVRQIDGMTRSEYTNCNRVYQKL